MHEPAHSSDLHPALRPTPRTGPVSIVLEVVPAMGQAIEVAAGIWWARLPLTAKIGHVNVYILEGEHGWTLIDTGTRSDDCRSALRAILASSPFDRRPLAEVLVTHHHPDHVGLAGELVTEGVSFWATRTCFLSARALQLDGRDAPTPEQLHFFRRTGLKGLAFEAYSRRPAMKYRDHVAPLPTEYRRLQDGQVLRIGIRTWRVVIGQGHAPDHATLWSDDGLALTGDQILPQIASNLSVYPSEPDADPIHEWIASCRQFVEFADDEIVCLPGHNQPFVGAATRCQQSIATQESLANRLLEFLVRPRTVVECLPTIYRREIPLPEMPALICEAQGFLNYLSARGSARRETSPDGTWLWLSPGRSERKSSAPVTIPLDPLRRASS